jgi:hypothetical protein
MLSSLLCYTIGRNQSDKAQEVSVASSSPSSFPESFRHYVAVMNDNHGGLLMKPNDGDDNDDHGNDYDDDVIDIVDYR